MAEDLSAQVQVIRHPSFIFSMVMVQRGIIMPGIIEPVPIMFGIIPMPPMPMPGIIMPMPVMPMDIAPPVIPRSVVIVLIGLLLKREVDRTGRPLWFLASSRSSTVEPLLDRDTIGIRSGATQ
jgi:hypothetical protein